MEKMQVNAETDIRETFPKRFRFLLGLGIFLTGFVSAGGLIFLVAGISETWWREMGVCAFARQLVVYMCVACCLVFLVKIRIGRRFFSKLLVRCIRLIGVLITGFAFVLPRLPDYAGSGFEILHFRSVTLIEGGTFLAGILLLIFAGIIREGFSMQSELDEVW